MLDILRAECYNMRDDLIYNMRVAERKQTMKKFLSTFVILLLTLCMILTSCVSSKDNNTETEPTTEPVNNEQNGTTDEEPLGSAKSEGYDAVVEKLFENVLNFGNGSVTITQTAQGQTMAVKITVNESADGGYVARIEVDAYGEKVNVLYRNGVIVAVNDGEKDAYVTDISTMVSVPYETMLKTIELYFESYNAYVEEYFGMAEEEWDAFLKANAEQINAILTEAGVEMTAAELTAVLDVFETAYASLVKDLGFETNLKINGEVELPSKADWHNVLSVFMTVEETANGANYTFDITPFVEAIDALISWMENACTKTVDQVLWDVYGAVITSYFPEVKTWDDAIALLKKELPGTTLVKDYIDAAITVVEETGMTMDEFYAICASELSSMSGEEITAEQLKAMVQEYNKYTLDQLLREIVGDESATMEQLYTALDQELKGMKFADIVLEANTNENVGSYNPETGEYEVLESVTTYVTVGDTVANVREYFDMLSIKYTIKVSLDKEGNLLGYETVSDVGVIGENGQVQSMSSNSFVIKHDDSVKIVLTAEEKSLTDKKMTVTKDKDGNLIVGNLPAGDAELNLWGSVHANLAECVKPVTPANNQTGYNFYVLEEAYWTQRGYVGAYIQTPDGKYYEYNNFYNGPTEEWYYRLGNEVKTLPEYDDMNEWDISEKRQVIDANGAFVAGCVEIELFEMLPSYYILVDGIYFHVGTEEEYIMQRLPFVSAKVTGLPSVKLPNNKTFYVVSDDCYDSGYQIVFGYIACGNGQYLEAACLYENGTLVDIRYREINGGSTSYDPELNVYLENKYDLDDYVTEKDGGFVISAALLSALKKDCDAQPDYYTISVEIEYKDAKHDYYISYVVDSFYVMNEIGDSSSNPPYIWLNWDYYFENRVPQA